MRRRNTASSISPAVVKRRAMSVKVPMSASPSLSSRSDVLRATMTAASSASLPRRVSVSVFMAFSDTLALSLTQV